MSSMKLLNRDILEIRDQRDQLLEALRDLVVFHSYHDLDRGLGSKTLEGMAWIRARQAIRNCERKHS